MKRFAAQFFVVGFLSATALSTASAQAPLAERVGRTKSGNVTAAQPKSELGQLQLRLYHQVDYPIQMRRLDADILLAQAKLNSIENRIAQYEQLNASVPPDGFTPSQVLPPSPTIAPQTADAPLQPFSPSSSFAHVAAEVTNAYQAAGLRLASLTEQKETLESQQQDARRVMLLAASAAATRGDYALRLRQLETEIQRAEFQLESFDRRLEQYTQLKTLTFSTSYSDLLEKLQLGAMEARLRLDNLNEEGRLLEQFQADLQRERELSGKN
jgi:hypothetical protein